jgi:hypothetical protein
VALQGKLPLYDFYLAVLHQSHNTATSDQLVSLNEYYGIMIDRLAALIMGPGVNGVAAIHPSENVEASRTRSWFSDS